MLPLRGHFVKKMSVNRGHPRPSSDAGLTLVRREKICTFADVKVYHRNPRVGGFHPINTLFEYGKSYIFAG